MSGRRVRQLRRQSGPDPRLLQVRKRLLLDREALRCASEQQCQRSQRLGLPLLEIRNDHLGARQRSLLRGQLHRTRDTRREARLHHLEQTPCRFQVRVRNRKPLAQRQHLEIPVRHPGQGGERHRVALCARGRRRIARGAHGGAVLAPKINLVARRQQRRPVRLVPRTARRGMPGQIIGIPHRIDSSAESPLRPAAHARPPA